MEQIISRSIFSPATGFIKRGGFDWTCNPYVGCTFGCTYCYAMFLPQNRRPKEEWGKWFQAKRNAVDLARKKAHKVAGQCVYMSSVTDPYMPAERGLELSRGILEVLCACDPQPRLLVQTRGPLVVRDIDVLKKFDLVRVNMSIPTDSEEVRQQFEPKAPPLERRWDALNQLRAAGISVGICVTPMLPLKDMNSFVDRLVDFNPNVLVVQDFHESERTFAANTGPSARELLANGGMNPFAYSEFVRAFKGRFLVHEGEEGFFPPKRDASSMARCLTS